MPIISVDIDPKTFLIYRDNVESKKLAGVVVKKHKRTHYVVPVMLISDNDLRNIPSLAAEVLHSAKGHHVIPQDLFRPPIPLRQYLSQSTGLADLIRFRLQPLLRKEESKAVKGLLHKGSKQKERDWRRE